MEMLNTQKALQALGNNNSLYVRILDKFVEEYSTSGATLIAHLQADEKEEAERLAHTLKGLAGSIGAFLLAEKAGLVEEALRGGATAIECVANAEEVDLVLGKSIEACRVTLNSVN